MPIKAMEDAMSYASSIDIHGLSMNLIPSMSYVVLMMMHAKNNAHKARMQTLIILNLLFIFLL